MPGAIGVPMNRASGGRTMRLAFVGGLIFFVLASTAGAQSEYRLAVDSVNGLAEPGSDIIASNSPVTFYIRLTNPPAPNEAHILGYSTGFRIYSTDGAVWEPITWVPYLALPPFPHYVALHPNWLQIYDFSQSTDQHSVNGQGSDTIGFAGAQKFGGGAWPGFDDYAFSITTMVDSSQFGKTLCIDSCWYPPENSLSFVVTGLPKSSR